MILCRHFLLLHAANVCPMVFFGGTFAHGSRDVLRICRIGSRTPNDPPASRGRHLLGQAVQLRSRGAMARPAGFLAGTFFLQPGRRPESFGTGSAADLSINRAQLGPVGKEYTLFPPLGLTDGGNGPTLGPQKFLLFRVIALAARRPQARKAASPIVPRPRAIEPHCPTN